MARQLGRRYDALRGQRLCQALISQALDRSRHATQPAGLEGTDLVAITRAKVWPMVRGLLPAIEQSVVLDVLARSIIFLTPQNIESVLRSDLCRQTAVSNRLCWHLWVEVKTSVSVTIDRQLLLQHFDPYEGALKACLGRGSEGRAHPAERLWQAKFGAARGHLAAYGLAEAQSKQL